MCAGFGCGRWTTQAAAPAQVRSPSKHRVQLWTMSKPKVRTHGRGHQVTDRSLLKSEPELTHILQMPSLLLPLLLLVVVKMAIVVVVIVLVVVLVVVLIAAGG